MAKDKADKPAKVKKNRNVKQKTEGILQLFVVASSIYAVAIISMGTEGYIPLVLVSPLALWSALTLIKRFAK